MCISCSRLVIPPAILILILCLHAGVMFGQSAPLPNPELKYVGFRDENRSGQPLRMYRFEVANRSDYPQELFETVSDLPPCGINTDASRTWLNFFDSKTNRLLYGFCLMKDRSELGKIWFRRPLSQSQPESVFIEITDRRTGAVYRSDHIEIPQTDRGDDIRNDYREIERLEVEWNRMNEVSDAEGKQRTLAPDSYHIGPSGRYYDKPRDIAETSASYARKLASGEITKFTISDMRIRMFEGVAVVTALGRSVVTKDGQGRTGRPFRVVHVWEKRGRSWQLTVDQVTAVQN